MKKKSVIREYVESFLFAIAVALLIRTFVVQPFKIPSSSMVPTLLVGDHILVNKFIYGTQLPLTSKRVLEWKEPERGDVIVFKYPKDHSVDFIKRLIGQPGERMETCGDRIRINANLLQDPWGHYESGGGFDLDTLLATGQCDSVFIPKKGMEVEFDADNVRLNRESVGEQGGKFIREAMAVEPQDTGRIVVPEDHYFAMGDNRNNSRDSRAWGFVKNREIEGKAFLIYWSWDKEHGKVRWDRIGSRIR